jgi:hypothetical protein
MQLLGGNGSALIGRDCFRSGIAGGEETGKIGVGVGRGGGEVRAEKRTSALAAQAPCRADDLKRGGGRSLSLSLSRRRFPSTGPATFHVFP